MTELIASAAFTFLVCVSSIVVLRRLSDSLKLVDRPDATRKRHLGAIPLCGGLAIFIAFSAASLINGWANSLTGTFWLGVSIIVVTGAIDDRRSLPAAGRLMVQLVAAIAFVSATNIGALSLGSLFAAYAVYLSPLVACIGVVFVVGLVNSWNMLDGIDGLAGGAAAVATIWLILVAKYAGVPELNVMLQTLLTCLCAFLIFNMRNPWRMRASIFLGDAGSTTLGAIIAYVIISLATRQNAVSFPALVWIVAVPVCDTLSLVVRRLIAHRSPMSADRWHLHHLLLDCGLAPPAATTTLVIFSAICGGIGYIGIRTQLPAELMALGLAVPITLHTLFVMATSGYLSRGFVQRRTPAFLAGHVDGLNASNGSVAFDGVRARELDG